MAAESFRQSQAVEHEAAEGVQDQFTHRALADGVDQLGLERLHPAVEEVLLGGETVVGVTTKMW
jgi:hypothetical protein